METLTHFVENQSIKHVWIRVRWQVLEEERDRVDRARIEEILAGAAGVKLEGRIIPVVRARAEGIARERSLPRQIEHWAALTSSSLQSLLSCLDDLRISSPEGIAQRILQECVAEPLPSKNAAGSAPCQQCLLGRSWQ